MTLFLLNLLSKFLGMYRMDTVLSLIRLVSDMLKILSAKLAFVNNKCVAQNAFRKYSRTTENLSVYKAVRD